VKSLQGKRMRSELARRGSVALRDGVLPGGRASIGLGGRVRAPGIQPFGVLQPGAGCGPPRPRTALRRGCWLNGNMRPVLEHGPRSLTSMRVLGCQTLARSESDNGWEPSGAPSADPQGPPKPPSAVTDALRAGFICFPTCGRIIMVYPSEVRKDDLELRRKHASADACT